MSNNPGCLASLLRLFGLGKRVEESVVSNRPDETDEITYPYRVRDDFLSPAELSFYLVLKNTLQDRLVICPKVSLSDLFFVIKPNENMSAYNRINRKHVDFVVCSPDTLKPVFAVELDDKSHAREDRIERDNFVEEVFEAAELPLVRVPVRQSYNTEELRVLIGRAVSKVPAKTPETQPAAAAESNLTAPPSCPKCGAPMVLRTAQRGSNAGQQFWGCPNYPRCREMLQVSG